MKLNPRVLFLCLLASILFAPWLHAQPISKYPYGMYVYHNTGIYYNNNGNGHCTNPLDPNESVLEMWNRTVNMNYFLVTQSYGSADGIMDYLKTGYFKPANKGKINFIYQYPELKEYSETHYIKFSYDNRETNAITFNTNYFNITPSSVNRNFHILASSSASGYIVDNLNVIGPPDNRYVIRPRKLNSVRGSDDTIRTSFRVRVNVKNSTSASTKLTLALTNGYKNHENDEGKNNGLFTKQETLLRTINTGNTQSIFLDFSLKAGVDTTNDNIDNPIITFLSSYLYAPKLSIYCQMSAGNSFDIESITLYDDMGLKIVEQNYLNTLPNLTNFITELGHYSNDNDIQTIDLCDEPVIGNFQPIKSTIEHILRIIPSGKKFNTSLTSIEMTPWPTDAEFNATMNRFFSEVRPDYYSPDTYVFGSAIPGNPYNTNVIDVFHTKIKRIKNFIKNNNITSRKGLPIKLNSILQLHNDIRLREPSYYEMLSTAYLSLLNGYNGILWWQSGPAQLEAYQSYRYLYPYAAPAVYGEPWEQRYNNYLFNTANMITYKKDAINKVASFLNQQSTTTGGNFILGDLLNAGNFQDAQIVRCPASTATMALGEIAKVQLVQVDILDPNTWDGSTNVKNLLGVNYFSIPGDNASYFLFTNLSEDGHLSKIRLSFKTTNTANFLRTYVLTNVDDHAGRLYPNNGIIVTEVPQDGVLLLRIVNTNTDESVDFPKGTRFGVARTENNTTKIVLDTDFRSQANVLETIIINTNLNAEVISLYNKDVSTGKIYTDLATFRVLNYSYNGTTNMQIEFKKYLQNNDGTFTAQSPATYIVPRPNAASTAYKVKSLSYDSDNDGIDEMGYCIAYNNRYFIYTFNGTGFTQRKVFPGSTPSTAPEYFNLDATVLAAKWSGYSTIYIYNPANHCFYLDKDRDLQINLTTEKQPMGGWFANWSPMPYTGDWYGDATWEYGVYEFDKPFGWTQFNLNHSHTDGWSWFEFPYGSGYPTDKPLVWIPRVINYAKSNSEAIEEATEIPSEYSISQNFPNPFNPATTIRFALPAESRVTLEVFNILGERVAELVNDVRPAGTMDVRFDGSNLASGIYIYKFNATSLENGKHFQKINKMMLLK